MQKSCTIKRKTQFRSVYTSSIFNNQSGGNVINSNSSGTGTYLNNAILNNSSSSGTSGAYGVVNSGSGTGLGTHLTNGATLNNNSGGTVTNSNGGGSGVYLNSGALLHNKSGGTITNNNSDGFGTHLNGSTTYFKNYGQATNSNTKGNGTYATDSSELINSSGGMITNSNSGGVGTYLTTNAIIANSTGGLITNSNSSGIGTHITSGGRINNSTSGTIANSNGNGTIGTQVSAGGEFRNLLNGTTLNSNSGGSGTYVTGSTSFFINYGATTNSNSGGYGILLSDSATLYNQSGSTLTNNNSASYSIHLNTSATLKNLTGATILDNSSGGGGIYNNGGMVDNEGTFQFNVQTVATAIDFKNRISSGSWDIDGTSNGGVSEVRADDSVVWDDASTITLINNTGGGTISGSLGSVSVKDLSGNTFEGGVWTASGGGTSDLLVTLDTKFIWGNVDSDWDTATDWNLDILPDGVSAQAFIIPAAGSTTVIGPSANRVVRNLTIGGSGGSATLQTNPALLTVNDKTTIGADGSLQVITDSFATKNLSLTDSSAFLQAALGMIDLSTASENAVNKGEIELSLGSALIAPSGSEALDNQGEIRVLSSSIGGTITNTTGPGVLNFSGHSEILAGSSITGLVNIGDAADTITVDGGTVTFESGSIIKGSATFVGSGTVDTSAATVVPGSSPTILMVDTNWIMGDLDLEILGELPGINGSGPAFGFDQIEIQDGKTLSLVGDLDVILNLATFEPTVGSVFNLITTMGSGTLDLTGFNLSAFESELAAQTFSGKQFQVIQANTSGLVLATVVPEPSSYILLATLSIPLCLKRKREWNGPKNSNISPAQQENYAQTR